MKNGRFILLGVILLSVCFVLGVFWGRNSIHSYQKIPQNTQTESQASADYLLDINTASKAQLLMLPGIGDVIADRIINYRSEFGNFQSTDDLLKVEGIGEKKLLEIEKLISVGG